MIDYGRIAKKALPTLEWEIDEPNLPDDYPYVISYRWSNKLFFTAIHIESPGGKERCWVINMAWGWDRCDSSVTVSVRGRDLKKTYTRARKRFNRRIEIYMTRFAKEFALIPIGEYPDYREDEFEEKATRGLLDY